MVTILGDDHRENDETFLVTFTVISPEDAIQGENAVTITIQDDGDREYIMCGCH